jgi:hypothetical protein
MEEAVDVPGLVAIGVADCWAIGPMSEALVVPFLVAIWVGDCRSIGSMAEALGEPVMGSIRGDDRWSIDPMKEAMVPPFPFSIWEDDGWTVVPMEESILEVDDGSIRDGFRCDSMFSPEFINDDELGDMVAGGGDPSLDGDPDGSVEDVHWVCPGGSILVPLRYQA